MTSNDLDEISVIEAVTIISDYTDFMFVHSPELFHVADSDRLPHPKPRIRRALLKIISRRSGSRSLEALKVAYLQLANWQDGVGSSDISLGQLDANEADLQDRIDSQLDVCEITQHWHRKVENERMALQDDLIDLGAW